MITERHQRITGTLATLGAVAALAACSPSAPAPSSSPTPPAVAALVARHPGCADRATLGRDGGASCAAEGHLYLLYLFADAAAARAAARDLAVLHPTGTVDVDGTDVWVTE